jgi:hypothetical protein
MASATANTFSQLGGPDTGPLDLLASSAIAKPVAVGLYASGPAGNVGGLCTGLSSPGNTTCSGGPDYLTFTLNSPAFLQIQLLDQFQVSDVVDVVLTYPNNSTTVYESSHVQNQGTTAQGCFNPNLVFPISFVGEQVTTANNSCLNVTTPLLGAGNYSITVWDIILSYDVNGTADPFGGPNIVESGPNAQFLSPARLALELTLSTAAAVPEPATFGLLGLGGIALGLLRRRYRK